MAITDLFDRVSDSTTGRPIIADLAAPGKAIAAASINLSAATNWTTTTAIHFSIYATTTVGSTVIKDATTQTDWKGTLSGTTISNLTLTGGTDRAYTAGAKVELTPTSRYAKDLHDGITVGHNLDGTHKAFTESSIVTTAALQDNAVTTVKTADSAITPAKLLAGAGTTWATQTWTPTVTGWGSTTVAQYRYIQTGKIVTCFVEVSGTSNSTTTSITLPVPSRTAMAHYESLYALAVDNAGAPATAPRWSVDTATNASLLMFYRDTAGTGWTASGTKQVRATIVYEAA